MLNLCDNRTDCISIWHWRFRSHRYFIYVITEQTVFQYGTGDLGVIGSSSM